MRLIGLTGGIASGKSTVGRMLQDFGAPVVDADQLARIVVEPGNPAHPAIVQTFGTAILNQDGTLNRAALGKIVFADPAARKKLEEITHPEIRKEAERTLAQLRDEEHPFCFYMAPLLIEAGLAAKMDEIWVVYADPETQLQRLMERDDIDRDEALRRISSQMTLDEKRRYGDIVIDNSGSIEETRKQVLEAWRNLRGTD